jgi:hypothetical protein
MFGKTIMRMISYAVAGAIAVLLGGRLLTSVASVVLAWRLGNPLPLFVVALGSAILVFLSRGEASTLPEMILNVLSWAASAYMSVVVFFVALPLGLVPSLVILGVTLFAVGAVKNSHGIGNRVRAMVDMTVIAGSSIPMLGQTELSDRGIWSSMQKRGFVGLLVPRERRHAILQVIRERPLLPVSFTRFEDADILFVRDGQTVAPQILVLLRDAGVEGIEEISTFHTSALLSLPVIEKRDEGSSTDEYVFCREEATLNRLVETWPNRVTLHPSKAGVIVVAPRDAVTGFETRPIPRGLRSAVVIERDANLLEIGGTENAAEHTA